ncbi:sulfurtransferase TusA family protein [Acaryochloris sp. 'Moss Beach']|uniref:sulfurtransferase TusA family protein n=1 Tax=Acaryochloris TaxID=155977 RepID=UPI001BB0A98D|nr:MULTISPECIES: sulfurtransferase TusA family protein [Acaryochloris]QUY40649.1 sulfurtransferase TusA family protein [Acaryochloris marina S15]UJB69850.1 sulfurtransferase TusA family protein [Acaryochloris sp. 'Moss Beach']
MTEPCPPRLPTSDDQIDLRGTPCPLNFVRTKLHLQKMAPGSLLEVWLDPGEPIEQVPDSLKMAGYEIEQLQDCSGFYALQVRSADV